MRLRYTVVYFLVSCNICHLFNKEMPSSASRAIWRKPQLPRLYRKSTTRFLMSRRRTWYIVPSPQRGLKNAKRPFSI